MYTSNFRSIPHSITDCQLGQALCYLQSEQDTIPALRFTVLRERQTEKKIKYEVSIVV